MRVKTYRGKELTGLKRLKKHRRRKRERYGLTQKKTHSVRESQEGRGLTINTGKKNYRCSGR